jgi:hypothetical protein
VALTFDDTAGLMTSSLCDTTATRQTDGRWTVSGRDGTYDRNAAITAMLLAERRAAGAGADDVFVQGWEAELREAGRG